MDVNSELLSGFPYRLAHASAVAELLASLIQPRPPMKGLITDLDDTLWRGILGDVGPRGVTWDLDHHSHIHAIYQGLLRSLAESGVLLAVASKNEPDLVEEVFRREDLLATKTHFFPLEVHWGPKSQSVERILQVWNIGPDSVVFVDDSPMELAEVKAAHPEIECLQFPREAQPAYDLIERLRELFSKAAMSSDDSIRLESLRKAEVFREDLASRRGELDDFLAQVEAQLTLSFAKTPRDPRVFELVNKTNQFSLNGKRYTEGEWAACLEDPQTILLKAAYQDKYGPLGIIAVLAGRFRDLSLNVEAWVMSCRAFSRRIEYRCLEVLFERFGTMEIVFDFRATPRNKPLQNFLANFIPEPPGDRPQVSRECFFARCPPLYHVLRWQDDV